MRFLWLGMLLLLLTACIQPILATEDALDDEAEVSEDKTSDEDKAAEEVIADQASSGSGELTSQEDVADPFPDGLPPPSLSADAALFFVNPALGVANTGSGRTPLSLPAAKPIDMIMAFTHLGGVEKSSFYLDAVEAALRYPTDFSYYIQNFTVRMLNSKEVAPKYQSSVSYNIKPAQQLAGRPYGLTVRLYYHDVEQKRYVHTVYNDTINLVEVDEGVDTETFSLYLLCGCCVVLVLIVVYHVLNTYVLRKVKSNDSSKFGSATGQNAGVELGTVNGKMGDVDLQWIPQEHLAMAARNSPSARKTARNRRGNRSGNVTASSDNE